MSLGSDAGNHSLLGESYPLAALLCLLGFFLHMVLSDPLLNSIGIHYSGEEGRFYEKIHPGTPFIFLSFFVLLWSGKNPIDQFFAICIEQGIYVALLILTILLFVYLSVRSGPAGLAFFIDTHMTVPICAIVLCYAPVSYCRKAVHFFIAIAVLNSCIGIAESIGKFRIFTFDPAWIVLKEKYFRASALRGHPLNNTMFTAVALFTAMGLRYPFFVKALLACVFMISLVAFGGRAGLIFSFAGLLVFAAISVKHTFRRGASLQQIFLIAAMLALIPVCLTGGLYALIHSSMGERILAHAQWDASAHSRALAFMVFDYTKADDIIFGMSTDRIMEIAYRMNLAVPLSDIENPWLLMFMYLGIIAFPFWLLATLAFIYKLMQGKSLALKLAVLAYFITASTSNSFGRKDSTYLIMVCAVICAARAIQMRGDTERLSPVRLPASQNDPRI